MKTRQDLIVATLKLLNAIAAGQSPEAEDVDEIDGLIDGKVEELTIRDVAYFPDKENFEDQYIDPLSIILANTAAPSYGQARNPDSVAMAEATLHAFKPSSYVPGTSVDAVYY